MNDVEDKLFSLQDLKYKEFHAKLIPNVDKNKIIGVRNPDSKKVARKLIKENNIFEFVTNLPHRYYEENNVHAYIINEVKDYDKVIEMLNVFLPYVDNWATCDIIKPKIFKKNQDKLLSEVEKWINDKNTYVIRFGIGVLMNYYLDDFFKKKYLKIPLKIKSDEYYVNMMIAWFYATALAKKYDETIKIIENKRLDKWVHNKTIQKAIESRRISDEKKEYLKSLKIK